MAVPILVAVPIHVAVTISVAMTLAVAVAVALAGKRRGGDEKGRGNGRAKRKISNH
jgi:hypothetical protein